MSEYVVVDASIAFKWLAVEHMIWPMQMREDNRADGTQNSHMEGYVP